MKRYKVEFEIHIPEESEATDEQALEWAKCLTGYSAELSENNPLIHKSFDPVFGTFGIRRLYGDGGKR